MADVNPKDLATLCVKSTHFVMFCPRWCFFLYAEYLYFISVFCFFSAGVGCKRYLKQDAVPSLQLPVRSCDRPRTTSESSARRAERMSQREQDGQLSSPEDSEIECAENAMDELLGAFQQDKGVQVSLTELTSGRLNLLTLLDSDQKLSVMTGIPSFDVLSALEKLVQVELPYVRDVERGIIVTLMRLKTGLSFTSLGVLLGTRGVMLRHDRTEGWLEILGAVSSDP